MKIAFLTSEYPHPKTKGFGGIATSIKNLASGLAQAGYTPSVLVYGQDQDDFFEDNGVAVYKIKNIKVKGLSLFLTQRKIRILIDDLYAKGIIAVVEAPDWTGITSFIKPKKCPIVIRMNGSDTYFCAIEKRPSKFKNRFLERRALQKANALLSVSEFTANYTRKLFGLTQKITIIPNGIALENFTKKEVSITPNTILYFGTLIRKKGCLEIPYIFNEVVKTNPSAKLLLVGSDTSDISTGSKSTWVLMQEMFSPKALANVTYLGRKPYHEIRSIIQNAQVCIFPSYAEALPVSWLEAMALEKPIVASNIGWANELMTNGIEGFLIYPTAHQSWGNAINMLLSDPILAQKLGSNARDKVKKHFSNEVLLSKNIDFYSTIS
jgi:glycosyltransferase involved in cell wall biosynthesis